MQNENIFKSLTTLCRAKVSLMVGAATAFGYVLLRPSFELPLINVTLATILLSAACSVWNQVQERASDALMERTKNRPVARGAFAPLPAFCLGLLLCLLALFFLFIAGANTLVILGLIIVLIYNGIYTPLKKVSCFSLLIGAIVGALPIVLGWVAAGGSINDPLLVILYGVYLLWQIPHFWLRVERNRADYQKAALPVPSLVFSQGLYRRILSIWFYAFAAALLMIPAFPLMHSVGMRVSLTITGIVVFIFGTVLVQSWLKSKKNQVTQDSQGFQDIATILSRYKTLAVVDSAMLLAMGLVLLDRLIVTL